MAGIPIDTILGAIPDNLKPSGFQNLPKLIMNQGIKIDTLIQPALDTVVKELPEPVQPSIQKIVPQIIENREDLDVNKLATEAFDDAFNQVQQEAQQLGQDALDNFCLPTLVTDNIITQRNNIVGVLNNVGKQLDTLASFLGLAGGFLTIINVVLKALVAADPLLSATGKAFPFSAGVTESIRSDLKTLKEGVLFDEAGESKITPIVVALASSAISVSIVSAFIKQSVNFLFIIDPYILKCANEAQINNLTKLSPTIQGIFETETKSLQTSNQATYKGFVLQIKEEPFTPTVTRRRAVGLNQYGIQQIQTNLSFTTNNQTLIDELKFIIDRDNLKAD